MLGKLADVCSQGEELLGEGFAEAGEFGVVAVFGVLTTEGCRLCGGQCAGGGEEGREETQTWLSSADTRSKDIVWIVLVVGREEMEVHEHGVFVPG